MSKRIAVLGAGPMGLATAYQLAIDGFKPIVFEADDRVGGMTATFDFSGTTIERFYHFHCTSDADFLQMLDELGISDKMHWVETKMGYWYQNRLQAWGNPLALLKFKGLSLSGKIRYGLHAFTATKRENWQALDKKDAVSWIRRWVGKDAYEVLWKTLFEYKFYHFTNNLSAAWIWSRIRRIGRSRYSIFREKLGYLEGGSDTLLAALKKKIEDLGGEIHLASPVQEVLTDNASVIGLRLPGGTELFDSVISTIPLPFVPRLIPSLPAKPSMAYRELNNIAVVCVIVKLRKSVSDNFWMNINDPKMDIPGLVEYSNLRPMKDQHIVYVPFYMPGELDKYQEPDSAFTSKVKSYLKTINPKLSDEDFIDIHASRYRYAQPICEPGFLENLPSVQTSINGLWVADTSHYYPEDRGISESFGFGRRLARQAMQ